MRKNPSSSHLGVHDSLIVLSSGRWLTKDENTANSVLIYLCYISALAFADSLKSFTEFSGGKSAGVSSVFFPAPND